MTAEQIISTVVTVVGVAFSVGYYPQAYHIWRKKSSTDVSILSYVIFAVGTTVWTMYGIYLKNWTIFLSFIFGLIGSWLVLGLTLWYRRRTS
jgi:uncharacterized protein with PQ loop repeat